MSRYVKSHLYDVDLDSVNTIRESDFSVPGQALPDAIDTPIGMLGLTICYDLRFPEIFRHLAKQGATAFSIPAAFLQKTGEAHWHSLQRARAIENVSFVIASAIVGSPFPGRDLYGHSLVVDPWGRVLLDMETRTGVEFVTLDLDLVDSTRGRLPCLKNRRVDLYPA